MVRLKTGELVGWQVGAGDPNILSRTMPFFRQKSNFCTKIAENTSSTLKVCIVCLLSSFCFLKPSSLLSLFERFKLRDDVLHIFCPSAALRAFAICRITEDVHTHARTNVFTCTSTQHAITVIFRVRQEKIKKTKKNLIFSTIGSF